MKYKKYKTIDLFCGAGGLSLGFSDIFGRNFEPVWANDFNQYAADTYNENFGNHCVVGDIVDLLSDPNVEIPKADVVIGGPPCQGFSLLNKNRDGDPRRHLWVPYMEVVKRSGDDIFVMENVPQLLHSDEY
jgi:DNA (cytosine-5)-methyltransferase 1